ncbi:MAG: AraC family transcriptional regulator [Eubacteriales bacterium]|nr:AraC family transcriptional regulator [Eubacteriales bacterium]
METGDNIAKIDFYSLRGDPFPIFRECAYRRFYPGERHVERIHPQSVLLLVLQGELFFEEEGVPISLTAGEWYIQRDGLGQSASRPSDSPYYFYVHFDGAYGAGQGELPLRGRFDGGQMAGQMNALLRAAGLPGADFAAQGAFLQLLAVLQTRPADALGRTLAEALAQRMAGEPGSCKDLNTLAKEMNYSPDYLIRVFKQEFSITPHQYLTQLRIEQARQLLLTTDRTLTDIAQTCGYGDVSAFHRAFCKREGCAPGNWRARMRQAGVSQGAVAP